MQEETNVYYNVRIAPEAGTPYQPISYSENRTVPILDKPYEYELAVVRFRVPTEKIPLFRWEENKFAIKLVFFGVEYTELLVIAPQNDPLSFYGKAVYDVQSFLDSINNALALAFSNLPALAPPTDPPFLTFEASTELFKWNIQRVYSGSVGVFFNAALYKLFTGFQTIETDFAGSPWFEMLAKDNGNNKVVINTKLYYSTYSAFSTLPLWSDFQKLVFESDQIPLVSENEPAQTNVVRTVLTDFQPLEELSDRTGLQYTPKGPLRWYNLTSKAALRDIDVKVFWENKTGEQFPVYIGPRDYFSLKILFRKRKEFR